MRGGRRYDHATSIAQSIDSPCVLYVVIVVCDVVCELGKAVTECDAIHLFTPQPA
jgi:hypothetical protein